MVHGLTLIVGLATAGCAIPAQSLPYFTVVSPPYDSTVESGPLSVQIRARNLKLVDDPWALVSDMTLVSQGGETLQAASPDVRQDPDGSIATFFFARVPAGRTFQMELHWREPRRAGCPPAKWTSVLGPFSTL